MKKEMKDFKIRSSCISMIMGRIGLTEKQLEEFESFSKRDLGDGRALTALQKIKLDKLRFEHENPKLPETCTSYLKGWYSELLYGDKEELYSKQINKGNACEYEAIGMVEGMEKMPFIAKNEESYENDFVTGTPDIVGSIIYDTKCSWNSTTFLRSITDKLNPVYEWQMRGYMWLVDKEAAKVCYCLVNTPEDVNFGTAVLYDHIPESERYFTFSVDRDVSVETEIKDRVLLCRKWLIEYDEKIKGLLNNECK